MYIPDQTRQGTVERVSANTVYSSGETFEPTVFFLARSPEAPKTMMMVLSLSSMELQLCIAVSKDVRSARQIYSEIELDPPERHDCLKDLDCLGKMQRTT